MITYLISRNADAAERGEGERVSAANLRERVNELSGRPGIMGIATVARALRKGRVYIAVHTGRGTYDGRGFIVSQVAA